MTRTCKYAPCGKALPVTARADAIYCDELCRSRDKNARRKQSPSNTRVNSASAAPNGASGDVHPLQEVRDERARKKANRDLGGLIRTAILDRLKTTGECTADDLIPLYPVGQEKRCRSLATAYFGSLASSPEGKEPLIGESGRRKSIVPERKGAKNVVWKFTKAGQEQYGGSVGISAGGVENACTDSGAGSTGGRGQARGAVTPGIGPAEEMPGAAAPETLSLLPEPPKMFDSDQRAA